MNEVNICEYTDYRHFLRDYYNTKKKSNSNFSYQSLSQKAQIKSRGFLCNVIQGKRNLPKSNIFGLISALKLNKHEAEYFETLVGFNDSENLEERNHHFAKLTDIKSKGKQSWESQIVRKDQFEYYSNIYHSIVRSLIGMHSFKDDFEWLSKSIVPKISIKDLKKSVNLLEKIGFISRKTEDEPYKLTDNCIATPAEFKSLAIENYHKEAMELSSKSLTDQKSDERYISSTMVGISDKGYKKICAEVEKFKKQIIEIAREDSDAKNVYNLNLQLHPLSQVK